MLMLIPCYDMSAGGPKTNGSFLPCLITAKRIFKVNPECQRRQTIIAQAAAAAPLPSIQGKGQNGVDEASPVGPSSLDSCV